LCKINDIFGQMRTDEQILSDKLWLSAEKVWLIHKGGFAAARALEQSDITDTEGIYEPVMDGKCRVILEHGGEVLIVNEDDIEKVIYCG